MPTQSEITVAVPTELHSIALAAQAFAEMLASGESWPLAVGQLLPVLFTEGAQLEELKQEVKDPQAIVLAALAIGQIAVSLLKRRASAKRPALAAVAPPAQA